MKIKKYDEIVELNKNSELKYKIGEPNSNILKKNNENFDIIHNFMSADFYLPSSKERAQVIKFYGFPTDEDPSCLAYYYTTISSDSIFKISVGLEMAAAEKILSNYGYKKDGEYYVKGVVQIKLYHDKKNIKELVKEKDNLLPDRVSGIEISLKSKYLGNRLY